MSRLEAKGTYFDGKSSNAFSATLLFTGSEFEISFGEGQRLVAATATVKISPRIGSIPRALSFPGGERFETPDNETIDGICHMLGRRGIAFRLENNWSFAGICAAAVLAFLLFSYFVLLPASAERIAAAIPPAFAAKIGEGSKKSLDRIYFKESALTGENAKRLASAIRRAREAFPDMAIDYQSRRGRLLGANAFALPGNTIFVTDELVELADKEEEVLGVIFHEIGHIHHKHSLIQLIQDSSISLVFFVLVGGDWINLPVLLIGSSYSRDHERAADDFAMAELAKRGIDSAHLATILEKMTKLRGGDAVVSFLSTHPLTDERAQRLKAGPAKK